MEDERFEDARRAPVAVVERVYGDEVEVGKRGAIVGGHPLVARVDPVHVLLHERLDPVGRRGPEQRTLGCAVDDEVLYEPVLPGVVAARERFGDEEMDGLDGLLSEAWRRTVGDDLRVLHRLAVVQRFLLLAEGRCDLPASQQALHLFQRERVALDAGGVVDAEGDGMPPQFTHVGVRGVLVAVEGLAGALQVVQQAAGVERGGEAQVEHSGGSDD